MIQNTQIYIQFSYSRTSWPCKDIQDSLVSILLAYNAQLYIKIYLSIQNVYLQKDFLYKEIRSTLTITNFNAKIA